MKGLSYLWKMARRRKTSCLLVLLFTMAATVFMLLYPGFIESTRARLAEAYENIEVKGWILNSESYEDPLIPGTTWKELINSGYFSQTAAYNSFLFRLYPKDQLEAQAGKGASDAQQLRAMQQMLVQDEYGMEGVGGRMYAYSSFAACDQLMRIRDDIQWLEGYDESCLEGDERICIISDKWGYAPGDTIPLLARVPVSKTQLEGIFHLKVAGTYPGKITKFAAVMPLKTMEDLTVAATAVHKQAGNPYAWNFGLNAVYFTVRDNQQLDQIKAAITGSGLRSNKLVRVRIDDRILKETVGPIESNLAQLEGSYLFFFVMIAAIGFLLSFLLARGRKPEYAVMRMLGESRLQITLKALLEQFVLCLGGVLLGAAAVGIIGQERFRPGICAAILLCYTVGAAAAVMLTVRVNVMDILRDKE